MDNSPCTVIMMLVFLSPSELLARQMYTAASLGLVSDISRVLVLLRSPVGILMMLYLVEFTNRVSDSFILNHCMSGLGLAIAEQNIVTLFGCIIVTLLAES